MTSPHTNAANDNQETKPVLTPEEKDELDDCKYDYPFKNIALGGGGSKGIAYVGTIRVLEEIGVWKKIVRFAGASAGAIVSMWAALGYDSYEIEKILSVRLDDLGYDARFGIWSFPYNMIYLFGWHPAETLLEWFGEQVAEKLGDPDATFADLYRKTGRELCVVVTNVNQLSCVYCHVKTTPKMPIRIAVRMSSAIPGLIAPVKYAFRGSVEELFCDGGLICNYPIHVYDGWYLSMKQEDNFLNRAPDLTNIAKDWDTKARFGEERNTTTMGILLYSEAQEEMFKVQLQHRVEKYIPNPTPVPDTVLSRKHHINNEKQGEAAKNHEMLLQAIQIFLNKLKENMEGSKMISRDVFKNTFDQACSILTKEQQNLLYDNDQTADEVFDAIDINGDGEISEEHLTTYGAQRGFDFMKEFRGFRSRKVFSVSSYFEAILDTVLLNVKRSFMKGSDLERTMGIDTDYLGTRDFNMEPQDKEFLLQQGKVACIAFLRHHLAGQKKVDDDPMSEVPVSICQTAPSPRLLARSPGPAARQLFSPSQFSAYQEPKGIPDYRFMEKKRTSFYTIPKRVSFKEKSAAQITSEN